MIDNSKEYILCAACFTNEQIVAGYRHDDAIKGSIERFYNPGVQGFLTSKNRFVNRVQAAEIAFKAGQIISYNKNEPCLISEDLY